MASPALRAALRSRELTEALRRLFADLRTQATNEIISDDQISDDPD